jgi:transposase
MKRHLPIACGLDVHRDTIEACILVSKGYEEPEVIRQGFTTLRGDLINLREWLTRHNCKNVAMESTGVYWRPVYDILEETEEVNLCLVNAQHMKNLPGRKTDVKDAQWIAELFMCGLLEYSFVPEKEIRDLRECARYYRKLTQDRCRALNRMGKLLQTHGFKLSSVLSSIDGVSAKKILAKLCECGEVTVVDVREALARGVKKTAEEIAFAVNGKLPEVARALLRHMLDILNTQDRQLSQVEEIMEKARAPYNSQIQLLSTIPGINILSATYIIAEIRVDMLRFAVNQDWKKPASRICSWAGLTPKNDTSAGVVKSRKIKKGNNYVKTILVQCAWAATKCRNKRLSSWYWSHIGKLCKKTAIIAVARKLLVYIFHMLSTGEVYNNDLDSEAADRIKAKKLESAKKLLSKETTVNNTANA